MKKTDIEDFTIFFQNSGTEV